MSNKIFDSLLSEKIENFRTSFSGTAKEVFYDDANKKMIHSLEFGLYRESICKDFLKFIIPSRLEIDDGFIISIKDNNVSTQCDIVIFDPTHTPLFESGKKQRFFPVETVVGIGEVKSTLSKDKLKTAINKLARIKGLRRDNDVPSIIKRDTNDEFDNYSHPRDQIFSFLICKSLSFDFSNLVAEFNTLYDSDIPYCDRHNMILSIDDGIFLYKHKINNKDLAWHYPYSQGQNMKNRFIRPGDNNKNHFNGFATYMFMGINSATIFLPEFTKYAGEQVMGVYTDEN
jgi:hypothetical protein